MRRRPPFSILPRATFRPIPPQYARLLLYPLFLCVAGMSAGLGTRLIDVSDSFAELIDRLGLADSVSAAVPLFRQAAVYSLIGFLLAIAIRSHLLNRIFVFSFARTFILLAFLLLVFGSCRLLGELNLGLQLFVLILAFSAIISFFLLVPLRFYWRHRSYGDLLFEICVLALFLFFLRSPLMTVVDLRYIIAVLVNSTGLLG